MLTQTYDVDGSAQRAGFFGPRESSCQIVKFTSRSRVRKVLIAASIGVILVCVLLPASYWFAPSLLCLRENEAPADAIVLLGGECFHRPAQAAELFKKGLAPRIIITGNKDWSENRLSLLGQGIPP